MSVSLRLSQNFKINLEQKRQEALITAERCIQILQDNFGATKVVLFSLLVEESPWDWHSELYIAARYGSKDVVSNTYSTIENIIKQSCQKQ